MKERVESFDFHLNYARSPVSLYTAIQLRPVVPNFERLHYVNLLRLKNRRMSVSRELLDVRQSRANQKNNVEQ